MHAFHFGRSSRRLFGAYDPAHGGPRMAAVICPPWGPERQAAHRTLRALARKLAEAKVHTMRFDYYGTGDSLGEDLELTLTSMREDVALAVEECTELAQVDRISLIGMRLGGAIALSVGDHLSAVDKVVLWDPVVDGKDFLTRLAAEARPVEEGAWDIGGYLMSARMREEVNDLEFASATRPPGDVLVIRHGLSDELPAGWEVTTYDAPPPWVREVAFGSAPLPVAAIDTVVRSLSGQA